MPALTVKLTVRAVCCPALLKAYSVYTMTNGSGRSAGICGQSCTELFNGALSQMTALSRSNCTRVVPPPVVQDTIVQAPGVITSGASVKPLITGGCGTGGTGVAVGWGC